MRAATTPSTASRSVSKRARASDATTPTTAASERDAYRFGGERICHNKQVRTDLLEEAVWQDVCSLLENPQRIEREYQRRLKRDARGSQIDEHLPSRIQKIKCGIARLVDAYEEGLLEKSEFEPRLRRSRDRLTKLEAEAKKQAESEAQRTELRLVIGHLQEFADRIKSGLHDADWLTRREILRALVKRVEVDETQVRVIYRVDPLPFDQGPARGRLQDCWRRGFARAGERVPALCAGPMVCPGGATSSERPCLLLQR